MELSMICILSFCTNVLDFESYEAFDLDMKFEYLNYQNNLTLHNLTYLHDAVEFNIKGRIEGAIRETIVAEGHDVFAKISAQVNTARRQGKNVGSCAENSRNEVLIAMSEGIKQLGPCLSQLEHEYEDLFHNTEKAKANAELLGEKLSFTQNCRDDEGDPEISCLNNILSEVIEEYVALQYVYDKLYVLYNIIQTLIPGALMCIDEKKEDVSQELNSIMNQLYSCVSEL